MLTVNSTINLAGQAVPNIIPAVQGDTGRVIVFTLADFTIPSGSTATYYVQKPSGEAVYNSATIDGNKVTVGLTAQSLAETGDNYGQVRILNGEDVVTSFDFILLVKPFRGIGAIESTTEMNIFDTAVQNAMANIDGMLPNIIAPVFNASTAYAAGDYVIYSGKLYQFTLDHAASAWTGADAEETTVAADLTTNTQDITALKEDISYIYTAIENGENVFNTLQLGGNNTAVASNGDGSYTIGTTDYGRSNFGGAVLVKAGSYLLYGVPQGDAYLSTTESYNEAIVTNNTAKPKRIVLESDATLYLCYRIASPPSSSFVIRPFLLRTKIEDNAENIENIKEDLNNKALAMIPTNKAADVGYTDNFYRYYNSGEIRPQSSFCYSNEIIVVPRTYYILSGISASSHITFYDNEHNFVSGLLSTTPSTRILIPDTAIYMIASIPKTEKESIVLEWRDYRLTSSVSPVRSSSVLADFNNAEWNKWYAVNIVTASDFNNIQNMPIHENGFLITFDSDAIHYAGRQFYITNSGIIYSRYYVPGTDSFTEWVSKEANDAVKNNGVLYNKKLTSAAAGDFAGTYTVVSGGFSVGNNMQLKKYFSIENRTVTFLADLKNNSSYGFGTRDSGINTLVILNTQAHTVQLYGFTEESASFLTGGHTYTIDLSKKYQNLIIKVTDMNTGDIYEKTYTKNGSGGAGSGAVNPDNGVPMQYDYYFCQTLTGTEMVVQQIVVKCDTADVVLYGDSITEPEAYWPTADFPKSWTQMLIEMSCKKVVTSGRSGTTITQLYERIQNELPYIGAKYCVVTIGTNGGDTVDNLTQLVRYIKSQNIIPILNHIPCYDNNGNTTGYKATNQIIDTVRANEGVKGCDFDLATSLAYDGEAVNTSMMWKEEYNSGASVYYHHPNIKGSAAMIEQLKIDVPELF